MERTSTSPPGVIRSCTLGETTPVVSYTNEIGNPSRCLYVSPQIEALTGFTADEWMADAGLWRAVLHPADRDREIAMDARHNESGEHTLLKNYGV